MSESHYSRASYEAVSLITDGRWMNVAMRNGMSFREYEVDCGSEEGVLEEFTKAQAILLMNGFREYGTQTQSRAEDGVEAY